MAVRTTISDEVWDQLDPDAGRPSPRDRKRVRAAVAAATVLAVTVAGLWWIGALRPLVSVDDKRFRTTGEPGTFALTVRLSNDARLTRHIRSVGRSGPGLQLISVEAPAELAGWTSEEMTLHYRVTDCASVPKGTWPIPVRVDHPWGLWGTSTAWVAGSLEMPDAAASDDLDSWEIPWQQALSRAACSEQGSSSSAG
jgi:hypothetical protein